ncbi:unnamed protein product [Alopecurus aequalis]
MLVPLLLRHPPPPPPRPYLQALLTPATPQIRSAPPRRLLPIAGCCFHCLSPKHYDRKCWDPVRCRGCGCSGHRLKKCMMPRPLPTILTSASTATPTHVPASEPTSPPPAAPFPSAVGTPQLRSCVPIVLLSPIRMHCLELGSSSAGEGEPPPPPSLCLHMRASPPPASPPHLRDVTTSPRLGQGETPSLALLLAPALRRTSGPRSPTAAGCRADALAGWVRLHERRLGRRHGLLGRGPVHRGRVRAAGPGAGVHAPWRHRRCTPARGYLPGPSPRVPLAFSVDRGGPHLGAPSHADQGRALRSRELLCEVLLAGGTGTGPLPPALLPRRCSYLPRKEEEVARATSLPIVCALVSASPFPAEHVNPVGIPAAFAGSGEVLEIDPLSLLGRSLESVRVVLLVHHARDVPCDIWPTRRPWAKRIMQLMVVRVWPASESFIDGGYQKFFRPPPPPPFLHCMLPVCGNMLFPGHRDAGASPAASDSGTSSAGSGRQQANHALLLAAGGHGELTPAASCVSSDGSLCWTASGSGSAMASSVSSRRSSVVIMEILDDVPVAPAALGRGRGRGILEDDAANPLGQKVVRRSPRLAAVQPAEHETMTAWAVKAKTLKDTLRSCTVVFQTHVNKNKLLSLPRATMGMKLASALRAAAALDPVLPVSAASDD